MGDRIPACGSLRSRGAAVGALTLRQISAILAARFVAIVLEANDIQAAGKAG
jgi:hypothetical protein